MDLQTIGIVLGVVFGAAAAVYPTVRDVVQVVLGRRHEPDLRELLTRRLNDHEETLVEHEIRIEKLENSVVNIRDTLQ